MFLEGVAFICFAAGKTLPSRIPCENVPSFTMTLEEMAAQHPEYLRYISARFHDPSNVTFYALDADMIVASAEGMVSKLVIQMRNETDTRFLKIEVQPVR